MPLFAVVAIALVPWIVVLIRVLPSRDEGVHWDIAWGGLHVAMALLLLAVALAAWRRSPWLEGTATASATLLFVDAWFDVLTSSTRTELVVAGLSAAFVELPLAALCLVLARDAERRLLAPALGLVVATKITKAGSSLAGDYVKIVVVKTNPGYAPDPGHAGTGMIVATFCP